MPSRTVSRVDITIANNETWDDTFKFGVDGDTSWSFANSDFLCDLKSDPDQTAPDLACASTGSPVRIVVDDAVTRILHFDVDDHTIRDLLPPGDYFYDLIMVDQSGARTMLMSGIITVFQGITIED